MHDFFVERRYICLVKESAKISSVFPEYLFWDIDMERLDARRDKHIIIPRALLMSNADSFNTDIKKLESLYSSADIVSNLKSTKERISNKVCELVALRYHIPMFFRFSHK
jgi:hypothetical protein